MDVVLESNKFKRTRVEFWSIKLIWLIEPLEFFHHRKES